MFDNVTSDELEKVDDILSQLDKASLAVQDENRRRSQRVNIHTRITAIMLPESSRTEIKIFTRNLSTSGIGFVCRRVCILGQRFAIPFDLPQRQPKLVLAQVTFCRYVRAGLYEVGAEFLDCISGINGRDRIPPRWTVDEKEKKAQASARKAEGEDSPAAHEPAPQIKRPVREEQPATNSPAAPAAT